MLTILPHADAFHSGGARSFDAVLGIFYNDAMLGRDTQFGGGDQEHFRVRLTSVYIFSGHNGFKTFARVYDIQDRFYVGARSRGCNRLSPALSVQQVYPLQGSRERRNAVLAHMLPIERFFGVTDALDQFGRSLFAEPLPENRVVALSEGGQELSVGNRETFAGHSVAPGLPMVFGRVDESSIHVPEYCSIHGHERPVETSVRISGVRIEVQPRRSEERRVGK